MVGEIWMDRKVSLDDCVLGRLHHVFDQTLYLLFQHKNLTFYSYLCTVDEMNYGRTMCFYRNSVLLPSEQSWSEWATGNLEGQEVWVYVSSTNELVFYSLELGVVSRLDDYKGKPVLIHDVQIFGGLLTLLVNNTETLLPQIDVRKFSGSFDLVTVIAKSTFATWPTPIFWNPQRVLHSDFYDDVLFIEIQDYEQSASYLLSLYLDKSSVGFLQYFRQGLGSQNFILDQTLIVFTGEKDLVEYSIVDLNNYVLMKKLPLYSFTPLSVHVTQSKLIYVRGIRDSNVYLLTYYPHQPAVSALYNALSLGGAEFAKPDLFCQGTGRDSCWMLKVSYGQMRIYHIPDRVYLGLTASLQNTTYAKIVDLNVTMSQCPYHL